MFPRPALDRSARAARVHVRGRERIGIQNSMPSLGGYRRDRPTSSRSRRADRTRPPSEFHSPPPARRRRRRRQALHLALVHNRCDIATLFLARGADASGYAKVIIYIFPCDTNKLQALL